MNLQEFWNGFKQNKIAINTRTQEEYNAFLQLFDKKGLKRCDPPKNNWPLFRCETAMNYKDSLYACEVSILKENGYEIILFEQLQKMIDKAFVLAISIKNYEKESLMRIDEEYKWIACDENGSIFVYTDKPSKYTSFWIKHEGACKQLLNKKYIS